jgi:hypothetical protein
MEFSFTIGANEYTVPDIVTVDLFQKAVSWDLEDIKNHKPFVSILTECPLPELNKMDEDTFNVILAVCVSKINFEDTELKRNIKSFQLVNLDSLTFGQFVDIDILIADGMTKHLIELVSALYQMPDTIAEKQDIKDVWKAIIAVNDWRTNVYREYDEFFELKDSKESDDIKFEITNLQLMWYEAILALAEQRFLDIQHVVERPYKEALNFLTWKKNEIAKQKLENLKRKNDLQRRTK